MQLVWSHPSRGLIAESSVRSREAWLALQALCRPCEDARGQMGKSLAAAGVHLSQITPGPCLLACRAPCAGDVYRRQTDCDQMSAVQDLTC